MAAPDLGRWEKGLIVRKVARRKVLVAKTNQQ